MEDELQDLQDQLRMSEAVSQAMLSNMACFAIEKFRAAREKQYKGLLKEIGERELEDLKDVDQFFA